MSQFEVKPYIWKPKDSELTVTLINDKSNPFGIFEKNHFDYHPSQLDNESNDLISDIQFDETFNILTFDCNNLEVESCVDLQTEFNECSSKTKQENTNFIPNEIEKSFSISDKHSTEFREFLLPVEDTSVEPNILKYAHNISQPYDYEANNLKVNVTDEIIFNELLKRFSKRISKVAIKTEVKSFIKHYTKNLIKKSTLKNLRLGSFKSPIIGFPENTNKTFSSEDVTFQSYVKSDYDAKIVPDNNESDEIFVVQSIYNEQPNEKNDSGSRASANFRIRSSEPEMKIFANFRSPSPFNIEPFPNQQECVFDSLENISLCSKASPKRRAIATSPIQFSEFAGEPNHKLLNLLNCMAKQNLKNTDHVSLNEKHKKVKSTSSSLFNRIFNRNKSKDSNYGNSPEYFSSLSKASSILSLDKHQKFSQSNNQKESFPQDKVKAKSDWLEVDQFSIHCEPSESVSKALSCHGNSKFSSSHLSNISYPDLSAGNNAVFIID